MKKCYFDHAATNPLHPAVLEAMMPYFKEDFGNALSVYDLGTRARDAIEKARLEVASLINAKPSGIIFTPAASRQIIRHSGDRPGKTDKGQSYYCFQGRTPFYSQQCQVSRKERVRRNLSAGR